MKEAEFFDAGNKEGPLWEGIGSKLLLLLLLLLPLLHLAFFLSGIPVALRYKRGLRGLPSTSDRALGRDVLQVSRPTYFRTSCCRLLFLHLPRFILRTTSFHFFDLTAMT